MAIQLSPGVNVSEVDLTTIVPSVSTSAGAFAGNFVWGPVNKRVLIPDEITLVKTFGQPDSNTYVSFFTCASFLAYGNNLTLVRAANTNSFNADSNSSPFSASVQVKNSDIFDASYLHQNNNNAYGPFVARYPGALGNSLTVSIIDAGVPQANGVPYSNNFSTWAYAGSFNGAPNTSTQAVLAGGSYDEMHIAVIDSGGLFTGTKGTVLEVWPYLTKSYDGIDALGNSSYYKNVLFSSSQFIYAMDPPNYSTTYQSWGGLAGSNFVALPGPVTTALSGGADAAIQQADIINAYSLFTSKEDVNIDLLFTGDGGVAGSGGAIASPVTTQQFAINSISYSRADCVAFVSPPASAVLNQPGLESGLIANWNNALAIAPTPGSYGVADSGWKYMFDKYNNVYRWVPLNGDIAGLCVYTDQVRDAWWSPAGFNRGAVKNAVKLAWNPNKTYRDALYQVGINPVVTFPGNGTVLFGDKTMQAKPSAFDRINVRRLFLVLEKSIAKAAQYSLFEFNDEFTRAQFVALVTPFLRDVQGRRGITDFRVVCDTTNNTGEVIDSNRFVGDIYIKPARSINFIQLNFVAVRTGVDFTTVVGKF
jgi:hypothetical protein